MLVPVVLEAETHKMHPYTGVLWRSVCEEEFNSQTNLQLSARQQQVLHRQGCDVRKGEAEKRVSATLFQKGKTEESSSSRETCFESSLKT